MESEPVNRVWQPQHILPDGDPNQFINICLSETVGNARVVKNETRGKTWYDAYYDDLVFPSEEDMMMFILKWAS